MRLNFADGLAWVAVTLMSYHYFLYPALVLLAARFWGRDVKKREGYAAGVSLIIAAYQEEAVLAAKLENSLQLARGSAPLEIIVVSDGSQDRTAAIARSYADHGVLSLHQVKRRGKTAALNRAIAKASQPILVFTDANTMLAKDALLKLLQNFADPEVGGVSGKKEVLADPSREAARADRLFWTFEAALKAQQARLGSIPTGDGELFAVRRSALSLLPSQLINDDSAITCLLIQQSYRVVYETAARASEAASLRLVDDFHCKARMVYGGYQILWQFRQLFWPPRSAFAWHFLSHKFLRHAMPLVLLLLFFSSAFAHAGVLRLLFGAQVFCYALALAAALVPKGKLPGFLYTPFYYASVNLAALKGLYFFLRGIPPVQTWKKAARV